MDLHLIRQLIELVEGSGISELEVRNGDQAVRIVRPLPGSSAAPAAEPDGQTAASDVGAGESVVAPMPGTFYAAAEPDADPFVRVGDRVTAGDVLCIIESMKMMNEITADRAGTCVAVAARNGQAVATGDLLFRLA